MTVKELIEKLKIMPRDQQVVAPTGMNWLPIEFVADVWMKADKYGYLSLSAYEEGDVVVALSPSLLDEEDDV